MKKPKPSPYKQFRHRVRQLLLDIGLKSTHTEKTMSNAQWNIYVNDYSIDDTVKSIVSTPDYYIETFEEYLLQCGLKKGKARYWNNLVTFDSYTHDQKLDWIIEYTARPYVETTKFTFLYNHTYINRWFKQDSYEFYNADTFENCEQLLKHTCSTSKKQWFYHSTSYKNARDILKHGPLHYKGRQCCDFGISPSFYLTPDIDTAIEYAKFLKTLYKNEVCIIVFNIDSHILQSNKYMHFSSATKNWINLTTDSRLCESSKNEMDDCDFVYGPMVANVHQVKYNKHKARTHNPPKYQLASKNNTSDKLLQQSIHSFIWMSK